MIDMSKSQIAGLRMRSKKLTWGSKIMRSILRSYVKIIQITQKHMLWTFWSVLMVVKCDLIVSEPHNDKFIFTNLLHNAVFNSLKYIFDLLSVFRELSTCRTTPRPHHYPNESPSETFTTWYFWNIWLHLLELRVLGFGRRGSVLWLTLSA